MSILFPSINTGRSSSSTFKSCGICLKIAVSVVLAYPSLSERNECDRWPGTHGIELSYFLREDCTIPQGVNVGWVEAVGFTITIKSLLAKSHLPDYACEGQESMLVKGDEAVAIIPRLLSELMPPFRVML